MNRSSSTHLHLGYTPAELASSPYAQFFDPVMQPLPEHVREALAVGAVAHALLPPVSRASELQRSGYAAVETGYTVCPDGAVHIAALTRMPGVTPAMWDWWFAWHGSEAQRYKLWHPDAHVHVGWKDGQGELDHYVGRVSQVVEYVGAQLLRVEVGFVTPGTLGLDEAQLKSSGETAICARLGMTVGGIAAKSGWLLHHIRPVQGGAEMRSRFWLAGPNVRLMGWEGAAGRWLGNVAGKLLSPPRHQVTELLVHDAQEMQHLAARLPNLYAAFGPGAAASTARAGGRAGVHGEPRP
ncbi:MAG: hypothetical protein IPG06_10650 [Haliea sp.]|nr:hypothetical protein [Haliea sp.]